MCSFCRILHMDFVLSAKVNIPRGFSLSCTLTHGPIYFRWMSEREPFGVRFKWRITIARRVQNKLKKKHTQTHKENETKISKNIFSETHFGCVWQLSRSVHHPLSRPHMKWSIFYRDFLYLWMFKNKSLRISVALGGCGFN